MVDEDADVLDPVQSYPGCIIPEGESSVGLTRGKTRFRLVTRQEALLLPKSVRWIAVALSGAWPKSTLSRFQFPSGAEPPERPPSHPASLPPCSLSPLYVQHRKLAVVTSGQSLRHKIASLSFYKYRFMQD